MEEDEVIYLVNRLTEPINNEVNKLTSQVCDLEFDSEDKNKKIEALEQELKEVKESLRTLLLNYYWKECVSKMSS